MKRLLALLVGLVAIPSAFAANPSYDSFNTNQFEYLIPRIWFKSGARMTNVHFYGIAPDVNGQTIAYDGKQNLFITNITSIVNVTSNSYATNLWVTNLYTSNFYAGNTYTTNLWVTNLYATFSTNYFSTNLYFTNLYATNIWVTNLYANTEYVTNLYVTNVYAQTTITTNLYVTNFFSKPVTINTNIYITNSYLYLNGTNVASVNPTALVVPALGPGMTNFIDTVLSVDAPGSTNMTLAGKLSVTDISVDGFGTVPAWFIDNGDGTAKLTNGLAMEPVWSGLHQYSKNVGAVLSVGDTTFVDMQRASQTNDVSGALTFAHATNGLDGVDLTHVRWFFNSSGSDQTLTIPSGWKTNAFSAVPTKLTNAWITKMILNCNGPTASSATQTNVYVSFEYFK